VRVGKSYSPLSPELQSPRAQPNLSPANSFSAWARFPAQGGCEAGGLDPSHIHPQHTIKHTHTHTHTHRHTQTHTHTLTHTHFQSRYFQCECLADTHTHTQITIDRKSK